LPEFEKNAAMPISPQSCRLMPIIAAIDQPSANRKAKCTSENHRIGQAASIGSFAA
jgi:hypothetical protein